MKLGRTIRDLREARDWTQWDLAQKMGKKSYSQISVWENDQKRPQSRNIEKLNEVFGLDIEEYAEREDREQVNPPRGVSVIGDYRKGIIREEDFKRIARDIPTAELDEAIADLQKQMRLNETLLSILLMLRSEGENGLPGDNA